MTARSRYHPHFKQAEGDGQTHSEIPLDQIVWIAPINASCSIGQYPGLADLLIIWQRATFRRTCDV